MSCQTSKGFLHKMRKPGKKKETTLAAEASLVDRGQFFDHTALEFEPAEDQMSELGSEATEIIFPPSIVLGGNRQAITLSFTSSSPSLNPQ